MTATAVLLFPSTANSLPFGYKRFHVSVYAVGRDKSTAVMQENIFILVVNKFNSRDI